jgi:hypothetical protein
MQMWAVCFVVFFGMAEFYEWAQGMTLSTPVLIVAGVLLAIASNYRKWAGLSSELTNASPSTSVQDSQSYPTEPHLMSNSPSSSQSVSSASAPPRYYPGPQLPNLIPQSQRSISFTIPKSDLSFLSVSEESKEEQG